MQEKIDKYISLIYKKPKNRSKTFQAIPQKLQKAVFLRLGKHIQYQIIKDLSDESSVDLLESLDPDDATDVLQLFAIHDQQKLLAKLSEEIKNNVSILLKFAPDTAGGLMTLDYVQINFDQTIAEAAKKFKIHETRTGKPPIMLVLKNDKVSGYLPGHELGFANPPDKVSKYVHAIKTIHVNATKSEVVRIFQNHPHSKLAVLDSDGDTLGIIYSDDVLRIIKEQATSTLYDFAGIYDEEEATDSARIKIKFRYKWLIINLATAFLAAFTVGLFDKTINKYVLLAVYMPIVAGMGGNAATQTLAVMVRAITLGQIDINNFMRPLVAEIKAGLVNGLINGVIVLGVVLFLNHNFLIGFILAVAMIINLVVAATFGTIIPLLMKSFGKDPASSATIFITTATDVLGFLTFLGLATILLH